MTNEELKNALILGSDMSFKDFNDPKGGRIRGKLTAIIYRYKNGKIIVSAELQEHGNRCVHIVATDERLKVE